MIELPSSRSEAKRIGAARFFNGRPCRHGHVAPRWTTNSSCTVCVQIRLAATRALRPPRILKGRDRDNARRLTREHYQANREQYIERAAEWRHANMARRREIARQWVRDNPGKALAAVRKRQGAKLQRTPSWADLAAIRDFYMNCPRGCQVDHVIPLRGTLVSGLHVLENLQYLPKAANMAKRNSFDPAEHTT